MVDLFWGPPRIWAFQCLWSTKLEASFRHIHSFSWTLIRIDRRGTVNTRLYRGRACLVSLFFFLPSTTKQSCVRSDVMYIWPQANRHSPIDMPWPFYYKSHRRPIDVRPHQRHAFDRSWLSYTITATMLRWCRIREISRVNTLTAC